MMIEADPLELERRILALGISERKICMRATFEASQWTRWKKGKMKTAPRLDKVIALNRVIEAAESERCQNSVKPLNWLETPHADSLFAKTCATT